MALDLDLEVGVNLTAEIVGEVVLEKESQERERETQTEEMMMAQTPPRLYGTSSLQLRSKSYFTNVSYFRQAVSVLSWDCSWSNVLRASLDETGVMELPVGRLS